MIGLRRAEPARPAGEADRHRPRRAVLQGADPGQQGAVGRPRGPPRGLEEDRRGEEALDGLPKGTNGVSTSGATAIFMFLTE